jgi:transketolase
MASKHHPTFAGQMRQIILEQSYRAHVGHIGSALSVTDIIATLYSDVLRIPDPTDPDRDRFVLSKGHAALALYSALFLKGWISADMLNTYCTDGTLLGVHPERLLPGVDLGTGSLGMGVSYATGAALAAGLQNSKRRVFALVSDAECNEGIVWESAMFAAHHKLSNLYVIIDLNGQQALGYTRDMLDTSPMDKKWEAFGWDVKNVDGHLPGEIISAIETCKVETAKPHVLIAHTTFGKGVSFMENKIKWHYWPMSESDYQVASQENSE